MQHISSMLTKVVVVVLSAVVLIAAGHPVDVALHLAASGLGVD